MSPPVWTGGSCQHLRRMRFPRGFGRISRRDRVVVPRRVGLKLSPATGPRWARLRPRGPQSFIAGLTADGLIAPRVIASAPIRPTPPAPRPGSEPDASHRGHSGHPCPPTECRGGIGTSPSRMRGPLPAVIRAGSRSDRAGIRKAAPAKARRRYLHRILPGPWRDLPQVHARGVPEPLSCGQICLGSETKRLSTANVEGMIRLNSPKICRRLAW